MSTNSSTLNDCMPDISNLTEEERSSIISVFVKAKNFEEEEQWKLERIEGQLLKYTNVVKGWQMRWFNLDPESGFLEYFEKEEHRKQRPRGCIQLTSAAVAPSDEDPHTFTVTPSSGAAFRLRACDPRERQHWVDRLRSTARIHSAHYQDTQREPPQHYKSGLGQQSSWVKREQDSLQLSRSCYRSDESVHLGPCRSEREPMVEASHQDVLSPLLHAQQYLIEACDYSTKLAEKIDTLPQSSSGLFMTRLDKDLLTLKATAGATVACMERCMAMLHESVSPFMGLPVRLSPSLLPSASMLRSAPISMTATEADGKVDGFTFLHPGVNSCSSCVTEKFSPTHFQRSEAGEIVPSRSDEVEDDDVLHESDLESVDEHKSVILHLLSQLRLGMDLTKVVLPTFILERRSLLEMFADCMAHPDLFLRISRMVSGEDRMMAVLEWYLTSFHAGRQGSVAKKPYNPIIGETFHCSWRIPDGASDDECQLPGGTDDMVSSSTVTNFSQLVYCAEQVSHHPPVSAIYFECPERKMCMNGSIWTKSKFMGMSIGVVMVGKVILRLLEHDEEYVFGLPSAYARSILTVPWVELGDKISISCEKTSLSASVVFHTKPFYGGKLHRVTAEVKNSASGILLSKVSGQWNGQFEWTQANGQSRTIDTKALRIWKKRVRPIAKQGEFESRRLWQHVTSALQVGDVNTATEHKRFLEERQREGERHRKELGQRFPTQYFYSEKDTWIFKTMLSGATSTGEDDSSAV